MATKHDETPAKVTPSRRLSAGWFFATKEFNPKTWFSGSGYDKGTVVKTAWQQLREAWAIRPVQRTETFENAVARLGLSEAELAQRRRQFVFGARSCYLTGLAILALTAYHAYFGNVAGGIGGLAVFLVCIYAGFLRAFRAWQIELQRLARFQEFLATPEAWLP